MEKDKSYLIEQYFANNLSEVEQGQFESALKSKDFRDDLLLQGTLIDSFVDHEKSDFIDKLKALKETKPKKSNKTTWIGISIALILLSALFWYLNSNKIDHNQLIAEYSNPIPVSGNQRGDNTISFSEGVKLYSRSEYENCIPLLKTNGKTEKEQLYLANAYIQTNQFKEAEETLLPLLKSNDIDIKQNAEWYYALTLLHNNGKDSYLKFIDVSIAQDHIFHAQALQLKKAL